MSEHDDTASGLPKGPEARLSALYRAQAQEVPPASLDGAILAAARRQANAQPKRPGPLVFSVWRIPLAAAAVVVLSVTLTTLVIENKEAVFSVFYGPGDNIEGEGALPEATPLQSPEATVDEQRKSFTSERAAPARQAKSESVRTEREAERAKEIAEPVPAEQKHDLTLPAEAPASPAPEIPGSKSEPSAPKERSMDESASRTMAAPSTEAPRGIGKKTIRERTPDEWLAHIRDLLKQGRRQEAVRSLAEFRKRYRDYRLPEDLRELK